MSFPAPGYIAHVFDAARLLAATAKNPRQRDALVALLRRLSESAEDDLAAARVAFGAGLYQEAGAALHALRGSVGTVGASTFAATTRELETLVREGRTEAATPLFERAAAELGAVVQALRAWLDSLAAPEVAAPAGSGAAPALEPWKKLLKENDIDAVLKYIELKPGLAALGQARLQAIDLAMARLDFPAVLAQLEGART